MILIVHDLETTVVRMHQGPPRLIQIGALKVEFENNEFGIVDTFMAFVNPGQRLTPRTTAFTGITNEDVADAEPSPKVLERFREWMGEDYFLLSWSLSDKDILAEECRRHGLSPEWLCNYNDIQKMFCEYFKFPRAIGLKDAMELLGIQPLGQAHDAMADAINALRVLLAIYTPDHPTFEFKRNRFIELRSQLVYSDGKLENNPFAALKQLLGEDA
ncbi:MAG: exonuclease domain-containing protein [Thermoflavifilum sp.]|nr:exonuclease domain-containing protein [Thermoflavifilum sp.]MCL6513064.1 exonuclease domain-containing protein [Alicyclobacillus sp.]